LSMTSFGWSSNQSSTTNLPLKETPLAVDSILRQYDWGFYG
jgi:hypothetical protein